MEGRVVGNRIVRKWKGQKGDNRVMQGKIVRVGREKGDNRLMWRESILKALARFDVYVV